MHEMPQEKHDVKRPQGRRSSTPDTALSHAHMWSGTRVKIWGVLHSQCALCHKETSLSTFTLGAIAGRVEQHRVKSSLTIAAWRPWTATFSLRESQLASHRLPGNQCVSVLRETQGLQSASDCGNHALGTHSYLEALSIVKCLWVVMFMQDHLPHQSCKMPSLNLPL